MPIHPVHHGPVRSPQPEGLSPPFHRGRNRACANKRRRTGRPNLLDQRLSFPQYLHDQNGAMQEAVRWAESHAVEQVDYLVVFGIGLGWHWKALLPWLHAKSPAGLVFLEDDLAVSRPFSKASWRSLFSTIFSRRFSSLRTARKGNRSKSWWHGMPTSVHGACSRSPAYGRYRQEVFTQLSTELTVLQIDLSSILSEFFDPRSGPLRNFGRTHFLMAKVPPASSLFDRLKGCPAIVVAAGPSLEQEIEHIRKVSPEP